MSTYKEIRGLKVRDYTTNPDNPIEGQVWYNTTANTARNYVAGGGTTTSSIAFSGYTDTAVADTEEWSGSSVTTKVLTD